MLILQLSTKANAVQNGENGSRRQELNDQRTLWAQELIRMSRDGSRRPSTLEPLEKSSNQSLGSTSLRQGGKKTRTLIIRRSALEEPKQKVKLVVARKPRPGEELSNRVPSKEPPRPKVRSLNGPTQTNKKTNHIRVDCASSSTGDQTGCNWKTSFAQYPGICRAVPGSGGGGKPLGWFS